jgi:hypothetical protein
MSGLRVSNLRGVAGSAPTFPDGVVVTGVSTATTFDGNLTGNVTGNVVGNVTGDVTGNITGTTGSFSGNVSVGGTLTYNDVTNVDSIGVVTARGGIKVGAGQSISAVSGIITYYGDGSQLTGVESGVSNFVASGTIANGATVIVTSDGKAKAIVGGAITETTGSETVFEPDEAAHCSVAYDSTNNKVVVAYVDINNNQDYHGTAVVGTVTGMGITFGPLVQYDASTTTYYPGIVYDSNSNKVVIAYQRDITGSQAGNAIVGTVSGDTISFGTRVQFESTETEVKSETGITFDATNNKVVIVWKDVGNSSYGTAIVGNVSGNSISFGSKVVFNSSQTPYASCVYDPGSGKVLVCYRNGSTNGQAKVGTVSGTSISFGSAATYYSGNNTSIAPVIDTANNKLVVAYRDLADSDKCKAVVGTVSGTSLSFGTPVTVHPQGIQFTTAAYDSNAGKVVVSFEDMHNNNRYGTSYAGTVSGDSITFGSARVWNPAQTTYLSSIYDSNSKRVVIAYNDGGNTNNGTAVVFRNAYTDSNLTATNYIGIAAESISDGATGKVTIFGGTNSGQTGLTTAQTYYVQVDGSLSTTPGDPSVVAGTSISSTKIIVKG